jgi:hypothetical protein
MWTATEFAAGDSRRLVERISMLTSVTSMKAVEGLRADGLRRRVVVPAWLLLVLLIASVGEVGVALWYAMGDGRRW